MAANGQLEIIGPDGGIRFFDLDATGLVNIGRDPENDIVIDSPSVAPFHAVLDTRQRPYQLVLLSQGYPTRVAGQAVEQYGSHPVQGWDTIELDGHAIILLDGPGAPAPTNGSPPPATQPVYASAPSLYTTAPAPTSEVGVSDLTEELFTRKTPLAPIGAMSEAAFSYYKPLPEQSDEYVVTHVSTREFVTDVDNPFSLELEVINGGDIVASFFARLDGIPEEWITIAPQYMNLREGERGVFAITVTPPRSPETLAGTHAFALIAYSPDYPNRYARHNLTTTINPYYDFTIGELHPKRQKIGYFARTGKASFPIMNRGNSDLGVQLHGDDDERKVQFEFHVADYDDAPASNITVLGPNEALNMNVLIMPDRRRVIGFGGHGHNLTITATPLSGFATPLSVVGRATSVPLIGPIWIILGVILMVLLTGWLLRPQVHEFAITPQQIDADKTATIFYRTSPFSTVRIDPDVGVVQGSTGEVTVQPVNDITYTITVTNLLTNLNTDLFTARDSAVLLVDPRLPSIRFFVDQVNVQTGQSVNLSWEVGRATTLLLFINGRPETIPRAQHTGSRSIIIEGPTTFELRAFNEYTNEEIGVNAVIQVSSNEPVPTPVPQAIIRRFDVSPSRIVAGDVITLTWDVEDVDSVNIQPIGDLPPSGSLNQVPTGTTTYVLQATNSAGQPVSLFREVVVDPAPTPTPLPGTPAIEFFTATPNELALGASETQSVTLAWSIRGDVTNVSISAIGFNISGLPATGSRVVSVSQRTLFILTATNQNLNSSLTTEVVVNNPVPTISSITPTGSTDVGGATFTMTVMGTGFVARSKVRWDGADRPTTFVSNTQLTVQIYDEDLLNAGSYNITVFNPVPGGGASAAVPFALDNPVPVISGLSPPEVAVGNQGFNMTITGSGYTSESQVQWNGTNLTGVVFINRNQLSAPITADRLTSPTIASITVVNPSPGGGTLVSNTQNFAVSQSSLTPEILTIAPNTTNTTAAGLAVLITGINFDPGAQARWQGAPRDTVYNGDGTLTMQLVPGDLTVAGFGQITVINPGGNISTPAQLTITDQNLSSWTPTCATASGGVGGAGFNLVVNFTSALPPGIPSVLWNGFALPGVIINNPTQITVPVSNDRVQSYGTALVEIVLSNGKRPTFNFSIEQPLVTVNPPAGNVAIGGGLLASTVTLGRAAGCAITQSLGAPQTIGLTSSDATAATVPLSVNVTAFNLAANFNITGQTFTGPAPQAVVVSPSLPAIISDPGSPPLPTITATLVNPVPTINGAPSYSVTQPVWGGAQFTITVNGTNFVDTPGGTSQLFWNGIGLTTTVNSATQLTAVVPASVLLDKAIMPPTVLVRNPLPGGGDSATENVSVIDPVLNLGVLPPVPISGITNNVSVSVSQPLGANLNVCLTVPVGAGLVQLRTPDPGAEGPLPTDGGCGGGVSYVTITAGATSANFRIRSTGATGDFTINANASVPTTPAATALSDSEPGSISGRTVTVVMNNHQTSDVTVTSAPAGINCVNNAGTCSAQFAEEAFVVLTVTPGIVTPNVQRVAAHATSFTFDVGSSECIVAVTEAETTCSYGASPNDLKNDSTVNIALVTQYRLTIGRGSTNVNGYSVTSANINGVSLNCQIGAVSTSGTCQTWANTGVGYTLNRTDPLPINANDRVLFGWGGEAGCAGTAATCTATLAAAATVNATFTQQYRVSVTGTNSAAANYTVTSPEGDGINCTINAGGVQSGDCDSWINSGTNVTLTRFSPLPTSANARVIFAWGGGCAGTGTTCIFNPLAAAQAVTATFTQQYRIFVTGSNNSLATAYTVTAPVAGSNINCTFPINSGAPTGTCDGWGNAGVAYTLTRTDPLPNNANDRVQFTWGGVAGCVNAATCNTGSLAAVVNATATFTQQFRMFVTNAPANVITSAPAGISCPGTCELWINAAPALTFTFQRAAAPFPSNWNAAGGGVAPGSCTPGNQFCTFNNINGGRSVGPTFP